MRGAIRVIALCSLLVLLVLAACGSKAKRVAAVTPTGTVPSSDLGVVELRKALESTVLEGYAQLTLMNIEAFADGVARDREVQFVGVTPGDVIVGFAGTHLSQDRRLYRRRDPVLLSKNLDIHVSDGGSVGWIFDEISYRVPYMNLEASIPIRNTQFYIRELERWALVAEHQSYGLPPDELIALAAAGKLKRGRSFKTSYGGDRARGSALEEQLRGFLTGSSPSVPIASEATIVYPGATDEYQGRTLVNMPSLSESFGVGAQVEIEAIRVQVAPSGRIAWAVCNLNVNLKYNGDTLRIPLRGSFVFEMPPNGAEFQLAQAHISVPLRESQLSSLVFGPVDRG